MARKVARVQCNDHPFSSNTSDLHCNSPLTSQVKVFFFQTKYYQLSSLSWKIRCTSGSPCQLINCPCVWLLLLVSVCLEFWYWLRWISGFLRQLINFPECLIPASCVCVAAIGGIEVSRGIRGSFPATNCLGQPQETFGQCCKFITFCNCYNSVVLWQLSREVEATRQLY